MLKDTDKYRIIQYCDAAYVKKILDSLKYNKMVDGLESLTGDPAKRILNLHALKKTKQAYQLNPTQLEMISKIQFPDEMYEFCSDVKNGFPIYSLTSKGGYYRPHVDHPSNGTFSHTLFLSKPSTYSGGELEILIDDEVLQFKLNPGECIIYETGLPHQVRTVTKGTRKVLVWWSTSLVRGTDLYEWRRLTRLAKEHYPGDKLKMTGIYPASEEDIPTDLKDFAKKKHVQYFNKANDIKRKYLT